MTFVPNPEFIVFETEYWRVNQRVDCTLPGYLMLAPKDTFVRSFSGLSRAASIELGPLLAKISSTIEELLRPRFLYVTRFGHAPGHNLHFHIIPVYDWVVDAMRADQRYEMLRALRDPENYISREAEEFDGPETVLFIGREFAERREPLQIKGPPMAVVLDLLRKSLSLN
jgi:diadenosine tetraphosphate (Ap4A) HIT family hydrolase